MAGKKGQKKAASGCVDPLSGLYQEEHFFIVLKAELKRLRGLAGALGLVVARFPLEPDWAEVGRAITPRLGGFEPAAKLGPQELGVLMPEATLKKLTGFLGELVRELPPASLGLALAWPGQAVKPEEFLAKATANLTSPKEILSYLSGSQSPFALKETAILPAEKESLFLGFNHLNARV
ncbi:MAG: hypothetical protein LBS60_07340 [Deltaproteobacteria bacterium]|nr:hypothetical protein [Deltaproteobacteria bacterium]